MKSTGSIEQLKAARRQRVAEEISDALKASGMSRKEFAEAMHRQPSEVTKWLSGRHNFTCDLLEEISSVLGVAVSGAESTSLLPQDNCIVDGYCTGSVDREFGEPSGGCTVIIDIPPEVADKLKVMASGAGMTFRQYVRKALCDKSEERTMSARDFCGIWSDDWPSADEIRSMRTANTFPAL